MQDRLVELETKLAFQEDALSALNAVVTRQQREIDRLHKEIAQLKGMMQAITPSNVASPAEETPPPHY